MNFTTVLTPKTFNRATQSTPENNNMLESGKLYEVSNTTLILLSIADFFSRGAASDKYFEWYRAHSQDKNVALSRVFTQVAHCELGTQNRIECTSLHGTVHFEQIIEAGENRIQVSIGNDSQNCMLLDSITTLEELQNRAREDIKNNLFDYVESGAIALTSITEAPDDIERNRIFGETFLGNKAKQSTVTEITYQNGDTYFFKPIEPNGYLNASTYSGIPTKDNRFAERSMFTYAMSELFGFHVVPRTFKTEKWDRTPGYVQQQALGEPGEQCMESLKADGKLDALKSNADFVRQMIEIQLLDALLAQVDRHMNNYFIDIKTNTVSCIDNDSSAGCLVTHPHNMLYAFRSDGYLPDQKTQRDKLTKVEKKLVHHLIGLDYPLSQAKKEAKKAVRAGRSVLLPPVMDTNMVKRFKNLSASSLTRYMSDYCFNDEEIDAACSRLHAIQWHITEVLEKRQALGIHSIIDPSDWNSPATTERLFPQDKVVGTALDVSTSYFQRDYFEILAVTKYEKPDHVQACEDLMLQKGAKIYDQPKWIKKRKAELQNQNNEAI